MVSQICKVAPRIKIHNLNIQAIPHDVQGAGWGGGKRVQLPIIIFLHRKGKHLKKIVKHCLGGGGAIKYLQIFTFHGGSWNLTSGYARDDLL
jgi:hypothetical protein